MSAENPMTLQRIFEIAREHEYNAESVRPILVEYYSNPVNRQEIEASPNRGLAVEVAVDLIMQDVINYCKVYRKGV